MFLQRGSQLFGLGRYFWDALREINPAELRADYEQPVTIGFFGRAGSGRHTLSRALLGVDTAELTGRDISFNDVDSAAVTASGRLSLAFLVVDATEPDWSPERRIAAQLGTRGSPFFIVLTHADQLPTPSQGGPALRNQFPTHPPELTAVVDARNAEATRGQLLGRMLQTAPHLRLALAHRFPALRHPISEDLIREASKVNAQFALMSSLPALVPVLGMFLGGMADILVLTKNQAMLVFKLAAIHGRDVDDRIGVLKEILPVIGSAFVWRTAARTAIGFAPAPIAALPKAAVAYLGTYTVGQAARYYYERGDAPPPEMIRLFQAEARRRYVSVNEALKQRFGGGKRALPSGESSTGAS
ncbi:MAG: hypothetical protein IT306_26100 [Chloroflexi bacterium]|nr:hypothetical protein [Chloroflexota bacterium]